MRRALAAAILVSWLTSCAAPADSDRQRANAQKQEDLKTMLERGQRN